MLAGRQIFDEIRCNYRSFEISFRIVRVLIANFMIQILIAFTPPFPLAEPVYSPISRNRLNFFLESFVFFKSLSVILFLHYNCRNEYFVSLLSDL